MAAAYRSSTPACSRSAKSFFPAINKGELAVVYALSLSHRVAAAAGAFSVDALRARKAES